jgi:hypothetical protein
VGARYFARTSWRNRKNYDWLKNPPLEQVGLLLGVSLQDPLHVASIEGLDALQKVVHVLLRHLPRSISRVDAKLPLSMQSSGPADRKITLP